MFKRLHDEAVSVRKSALMVISHMILNGVLKGRGQMAPVAACLEDSEQKVADLARLFFHEVSINIKRRRGERAIAYMESTVVDISITLQLVSNLFYCHRLVLLYFKTLETDHF